MKFLKFIPLLILVLACSKNSDVSPKLSVADILGKWRFESVKGSYTVNGKKETYFSKESDFSIISSLGNFEIKPNGVLILEDSYGELSYKLNGNKIVITNEEDDISLTFYVKIQNYKLILSGDKTTLKTFIDELKEGGFGEITEWNEEATFI